MDELNNLIEKIDNIDETLLNEQDLSLLVEEISIKSDNVLKEISRYIKECEND